jgi:polyhydroxyalkanoate synthase
MPPSPPWFEAFPQFDPAAWGETGEAVREKYTAAAKAFADSFTVPVGLTPREEVWALNKARLYRYTPVNAPPTRRPIPLLLVYALINKPFIFDLIPGRSFIEYMTAQGFDVFLLDWGAPGPEDARTTLDDYVSDILPRAIRKMLRLSGADAYSLLGYCLGATLAATYAALAPPTPPRNLILLTAPLDFSGTDGVISAWAGEKGLDVDKLADTFGLIPGDLIKAWAKLVRPAENTVGVYVTMLKMLDDPDALRGWQAMHRWVEETVPFAGAAFRQFITVYVRQNALMEGTLVVRGRQADLRNIRAALLNIAAEYDHLVPRASSQAIMDKVASADRQFRLIPAPHVGILISRSARDKLWPEIANWLAPRSG